MFQVSGTRCTAKTFVSLVNMPEALVLRAFLPFLHNILQQDVGRVWNRTTHQRVLGALQKTPAETGFWKDIRTFKSHEPTSYLARAWPISS